MKKIILLIGVAVLLIGGITYGITSTNATSKQEPVIEKEVEQEDVETDSETGIETEEFMEAGAHEAFEEVKDYETFEEYQAITEVIEEDFDEVRVVNDNKRNRVLLFVNDKGHTQYKSIYVKKTNRLKVIDFNGGLIFNDILALDTTNQEVNKKDRKHHEHQEKAETTAKETISNGSSYAEHAIIKDHIDLNAYSENVVEDNDYKRVILYEDANGHKQYKSIYVKKDDHLKIIDFNGGLLYNGQL